MQLRCDDVMAFTKDVDPDIDRLAGDALDREAATLD